MARARVMARRKYYWLATLLVSPAACALESNVPAALAAPAAAWILLALVVLLLALGVSYYLHSINRRLREAQATLRESEERFRTLATRRLPASSFMKTASSSNATRGWRR